MRIPFSVLDRQHAALLPELMAAVEAVFRKGDFILGGEVQRFEQAFADYHGMKHAVGVNSGTDALLLSLRALEIGVGDEVITTANTFITSVSSIALTGATPVLVDIAEDDNIDVRQIESHITEKTKAIMPVHWTGRPSDMHAILALADKHGLKIVEDCAQAISARYRGQLVGTFGEAGCFSLHPFKTLNACGDAGVILTNDVTFVERLHALRQNGLTPQGECHYWSNNSRLDTIQAAILNVKMRHFEKWTARRVEIANFYTQTLSSVDELTLPTSPDAQYFSVFHTYIVKAKHRDSLRHYLAAQGIETRVHYQVPIHRQPVAKKQLGYTAAHFPQMEYVADHALSLPIYPELQQDELESIVQHIKSFYLKTGGVHHARSVFIS